MHHVDDLEADQLSAEEWEQLTQIADALKPFEYITQRLEGHGTQGSHGVIWEALVSLDYLLSEIESRMTALEADARARGQRSTPLLVAYQNAWEKLRKYNDLTDENHEIYAAAALLNPCLRKGYFINRWTAEAAAYIEPMIQKNREIWETVYRPVAPPQPITEITQETQSSLDRFILNTQQQQIPIDSEFNSYIEGIQTKATSWKERNLFEWWHQQSEYPTLRQWALDVLSIPAMSAEMERVFSQAKRSLTDDRNRLSDGSTEALLCLKHWLDHGLVPK